MIVLILEIGCLEGHGGENRRLFPWGGEIVGCKGRADGPDGLRSGAAFRHKGSVGAGRRLGCDGDELGLGESRIERNVGRRQSK